MGNCCPSVAAHGQLWDLHKPGFNRADQAEGDYHPRERVSSCLADSPHEIRRRGQVHTKIDAALFLNTVKPFDPNRCRASVLFFLVIRVWNVFVKPIVIVLVVGITIDSIYLTRQ